MKVLDTVHANLWTKKGIRTLSPKNPKFIGLPPEDRKSARRVYHQGNIFPWLTGHFFEALFALKGKIALPLAKQFYNEFEKEMTRKGMGAISEYYQGNPPHDGRGAISQAWNTAELLRIEAMITKFETAE
jgi:glycogen debranching enzyme